MEYIVIWHYVANHGAVTVEAASEADAIRKVISGFSVDFGKKATLYAARKQAVMSSTPESRKTAS